MGRHPHSPLRAVPAAREASPRAIPALVISNLAIGLGIWLPAASMNSLVLYFDEPPETLGLLISVAAIVVCLGAPVFAALTNRWDRRMLLSGSLALYALGHAAFALADSFEAALVIRMVMISSAAIFTPQAAAIVSQIAPAERQGQTIALVYSGWAMATAFGLPTMSFAASLLGWKAVALSLAALSLIATLSVWVAIPQGLRANSIAVRDWLAICRHPLLALVLSATLITCTGQFVLFPYATVELDRITDMTAGQIALVLFLFGVAGVFGNRGVVWLLNHTTPVGASITSGVIAAFGLLLWGSILTGPVTAAIVASIWGLGFTSAVPMQQARLAQAAPLLSSAAIALNTSAIYLGQAIGAWTGGSILAAGAPALLAFVGCAIVLLGCAISLFAIHLGEERQA